MISSKLGHSLDPLILRVYRALSMGSTVSPNTLTVAGALLACAASAAIGANATVLGGLFLALSGAFDLADGALARSTGRVTPFGAFLDSVLDRYSDLLVMGAILFLFVREGAMGGIIAALVASVGIAVIPYAKARADAAGLPSDAGLLERPERILILLCGLFSGLLMYAVLLLAVLTHVTVLQRILHARRGS